MDNHELKIRKGQAYNLAVAAAISKGKATDPKEIFALFQFYYNMGDVLQLNVTMEELEKLCLDVACKEI